tara:strand:- start:720 stop:1262 length:543 start_codon:yes stop_codon:yes gene_type:complete
MDIAQVKKQFSDKLSICLSLCCILHCIALPVIILMIPSFASLWINNEKVHVILVLFAVPISLFAMAKSLRIHHNYKCISLAVIGLSLLVGAIFMHDINFGSENSHIGHKETTHHEEAGHKEATHHEEAGHKDATHHEEDEHEHHEHGGIGETLETIFTVLGGLILLGAHFLNIRSIRESI